MRTSIILLLALLETAAAQAQIAVVSDRFAYTGSVTRYASLADAQTSANSLATFSLAGANRDIEIIITRGIPTVPDFTYIGTKWANGNPGNGNHGYVQVPIGAGTQVAPMAYWDISRSAYVFDIHGSNTFAPASTLLWNGTDSNGQDGTFLEYDLSLVVAGLVPAVQIPSWNTYISNSDPSAVVGRFSGLFLNSSSEAAANGYYSFDLSLNLDSWLYANRNDPASPAAYSESLFIAPAVVPEPSSFGMIAAGVLLALGVFRRFRSKRG